MLWKPRVGGTASSGEFIRARSLVAELHRLDAWNPWALEDKTEEYNAALSVCGQWTRAEPGFRPRTREEVEAEYEEWLAGLDARVEAEVARAERDRAERSARYEPGREAARLALLEQRALLADDVREREEILSGELYPAMEDNRKQAHLAGLDQAITRSAEAADRLAAAAGDFETVVDKNGWLPAERRAVAMSRFKADRIAEVRELRARVPARQAELKQARGRPERAAIREALRKDTARLAFLEQIPPMTAGNMCSECVTPAAWHSFSTTFSDAGMIGGPCPAWPRWKQKVEEARRLLLALSERQAPPPAARPEPIAVIPSGLPIEEIVARLTALQAERPGAQVRRGNRNRWEIWPPEPRPCMPSGKPGPAGD